MGRQVLCRGPGPHGSVRMSVDAIQPLVGRRILVTGASGFIGSALVGRLHAAGAEVHGFTRRDREPDAAVRHWRIGDVADLDAVRAAMAASRPDTVFHLAAEVIGGRGIEAVLPTLRANLVGAVHVLQAASEIRCSRIVIFGSFLQEPVGRSPDVVPSSPYGAAKWAAAAYGRMFHALYGSPVVIVRPSMIYGPGQRDLEKIVPYTTLSLLQDRAPRLSSGRWRVDWLYVDDLARALVATAVVDGLEGRTLDLGSGEQRSIREVVLAIAALTGSSVKPMFGSRPDRPFEPRRPAVDVETVASILGWAPAVTIREGLARTIDWYRAELAAGRIDL